VAADEQHEFAEIFARANDLVGQAVAEFGADFAFLDDEHGAAELAATEDDVAGPHVAADAVAGEQRGFGFGEMTRQSPRLWWRGGFGGRHAVSFPICTCRPILTDSLVEDRHRVPVFRECRLRRSAWSRPASM
jgi:hypothetical protein